MTQYGLPALHGLAIWWFSTGLILFLDGLPRRTFRWSMAAATMLLGAAVYGLAASASYTSIYGAYCAFTCAVLIWGWLEISFYMGYVTGPRTHHCPNDCSGWRHFGHAIQACLYHEIAVLALAAFVVCLTRGSPNQFGTWTFIVLWWMHQSARLNVFLGVRNLNAEFLPEHLSHIRGFFSQCADEPAISFLSDSIHHRRRSARSAGAGARGKSVPGYWLHFGRHNDGAGDFRTLVPGFAASRGQSLEQTMAMGLALP